VLWRHHINDISSGTLPDVILYHFLFHAPHPDFAGEDEDPDGAKSWQEELSRFRQEVGMGTMSTLWCLVFGIGVFYD
jgi:hypothetical protein